MVVCLCAEKLLGKLQTPSEKPCKAVWLYECAQLLPISPLQALNETDIVGQEIQDTGEYYQEEYSKK